MTYTAKQAVADVDTSSYELFTTESAVDTDDKAITIKKSLGRHTVEQLNARKKSLQDQIDDVDEKLAAIESITAEVIAK